MPDRDGVPNQIELMNPTLGAIRFMGGRASIREITNRVIEDVALSSRIAEISHGEYGSQTRLEYNLGWARTRLKNAGLIVNLDRGIWMIPPKGRNVKAIDASGVVRYYLPGSQPERESESEENPPGMDDETPPLNHPPSDSSDEVSTWRETLSSILLNIPPDAFERLCQRVLRESGFTEVRVTGRSGDGGIDGHGVIRLAGLISFPVIFQCKRYKGSVPPNVVRDFRGAISGRSDKGLIITTGRFTGDAEREATRDGVSPIDLIDGKLLMDKLKELGLGVNARMVEVVEVDTDWFASI